MNLQIVLILSVVVTAALRIWLLGVVRVFQVGGARVRYLPGDRLSMEDGITNTARKSEDGRIYAPESKNRSSGFCR